MPNPILNWRAKRRQGALLAGVPRLVRLVLIAILAALLARLFWVIVTPVGPVGDWRAPTPRLLSEAEQSALLLRVDPFPQSAASAQAGEGVTDLELELFGIRENRGAGTGSAIIAGSDGEQVSYAVGEEVAPGVTLAAVAFDHVVLDRGGVRERLYIDNSIPAETVSVVGGPPAGTEAAVAAAIPNLRLLPRTTGNRITGARLPLDVEPQMLSFFRFQQGDVIVGVNGAPINSQSDIDELKASLKPAARLALDVERGDGVVTVSVNL
ncbi:type II secretion system protein N [Sphingomicrobium sediminis]|uniref:PDZ domain-containing protein n=1 Tax=Sphingomicrobium sediminis TaxID=2950949 RepID=A0A9X2J3M8_9SPHN|nr:type II secretion system protein N [Sphingomicrobium sediminis]MCM8558205.1 PDZ domain-containing protein [Sphingomicrobium sediminis]